MSTIRTPPHLAQPKLTAATASDGASMSAAIDRGFYESTPAELAVIMGEVAKLDRFFGFQVDGHWISTFGSFARTMCVPGGAALPVSAVTAVTVSASYRRRGLLTTMMQHELTRLHDGGTEPLAVLWASEAGIYGRFGYAAAAQRLSIEGESSRMRFLPSVNLTDGSVNEVSQDEFLNQATDVRNRIWTDRPGHLNRDRQWWLWMIVDPEQSRGGASERRYLVHYNDSGEPDGFAYYRVKEESAATGPCGVVQVNEIDAETSDAYAALWNYVFGIDLTRTFNRSCAPVDDILRHLVIDPRAIESRLVDNLYVRIIDIPAALEARSYLTNFDVCIKITDPQLPANDGVYRVIADRDRATVQRTTAQPDLSMSILELAAIYLGGITLSSLVAAGRVTEYHPGTAARVSAAFGVERQPMCPDSF